MKGKLAQSKSGHDKGSYYVIIKEEEADLYLADGRLKTVEKPKRKNKKHIQIKKKASGRSYRIIAAGWRISE